MNNDTRAFLIVPGLALKTGRRYIVAIRSLVHEDGSAVQPSEAFAALRDGTATSDPDVEERRALFEDIFGILGANGVSRSNLIQAWDFTVASEYNLVHRQFDVLEDALARMPETGPEYRIFEITDDTNANIARRIIGLMSIPLYMTSPGPGSTLVLDENDRPVFQKFTWIKFTVLIPRSAVDTGVPAAVMQYGHGLLGGQGEVEGGYLSEIANKYNYILAACDWQGMSAEDAPFVIEMMLRDIGSFNIIPERLTQGVLNSVLLMKVLTGPFMSDAAMTYNGKSVVDPTQRYYHGNSQGGIFGHNYLALSPWVNRGVLGVPGGPYNVLLARSVDFTPFFVLIKSRFPASFDQIFLLGFMGQLWDRSEPAGYLNYLNNNEEKQLLFQYGIGDAQVSYLGAYGCMRSVNAAIFENNVVEATEKLYGFDVVSGSVANRSVGVGFKYHGVPDVRFLFAYFMCFLCV